MYITYCTQKRYIYRLTPYTKCTIMKDAGQALKRSQELAAKIPREIERIAEQVR